MVGLFNLISFLNLYSLPWKRGNIDSFYKTQGNQVSIVIEGVKYTQFIYGYIIHKMSASVYVTDNMTP